MCYKLYSLIVTLMCYLCVMYLSGRQKSAQRRRKHCALAGMTDAITMTTNGKQSTSRLNVKFCDVATIRQYGLTQSDQIRHCNTCGERHLSRGSINEIRIKVERKCFAPQQTPFPGARDGQNLIRWITLVLASVTAIDWLIDWWRWSLLSPTNPVWWGSMHAILSYRGNRPTNKQNQKQTYRQDRLQYTAQLSAIT